MMPTARIYRLNRALTRPLILAVILACTMATQQTALASPFGQGVFGAQVPFGSATSISVALSGNVNLSLTPSGGNFSANGSNTVTVTSTDVEGYDLYIYCPGNSSLVNTGGSIPASSNSSPAALATDTWGYNTDGSSNFMGLSTSPTLLKAATGPYESGDITTVTYGVLTSITTPEGSYSAPVTFTAVAINQ